MIFQSLYRYQEVQCSIHNPHSQDRSVASLESETSHWLTLARHHIEAQQLLDFPHLLVMLYESRWLSMKLFQRR